MTTTSMALASVEGADLGDARRARRLIAVVDSMTQRPSLSLPQVLNEAELEAAYRLMSNDAVLFNDISFRRSTKRRRDDATRVM